MLLFRSPKPVIVPEKSWELGGKLRLVEVVPETDRLRMYYQVTFADAPLQNILCVAYSRDGFVWERAALADGTNIVMRSSGHAMDWGVFSPQKIIRNPNPENPAHTWLMTYWERPSIAFPPGICLAASTDGFRWQLLHDQPIITGMNDAAAFVPAHPELKIPLTASPYFIYQQTWKYNPHLPQTRDNLKAMHRVISIWVCRHFPERWLGPVTVLEPDEHDPPDLQFYLLNPFLTQTGYAGLLHGHHTGNQTMDIQLVTSRDGWTWQRAHGRRPVLPLGEDGHFDCGMVYANATPMKWNGRLHLFYNGRPTVHDGKLYATKPVPEPSEGIGLAIFSEALLQ
jgi:hypothetical protein